MKGGDGRGVPTRSGARRFLGDGSGRLDDCLLYTSDAADE